MTTGILYCYAGADPAYLTYLTASVKSLRNQGYAGPISVVTNEAVSIAGVDLIPAPAFSNLKELKVKSFALSPYDQTLYLDCDTYALLPIDPIWAYLGSGDLAMSGWSTPLLSGVRHGTQAEKDYTLTICPPSMIHYNSGVVLWTKNAGTTAFFSKWVEEWGRYSDIDELALARALVITGIPCVTMPPSMNSFCDAQFRRPDPDTVIWHDASNTKYAPILYPELFQ